MNRSLAILAIGLFFGGGIGFVTAASQGVTLDGHDHSNHDGVSGSAQHDASGAVHATSHEAHQHLHARPLALPLGPGAPTVRISLHADPVSGWNLHVVTTDFRFAPENASSEHVAGEGHAHVYVDGTKVARLYGPWLHIADLPNGQSEVKVTLNTNDHRPITIGGKPLAARTTVSSK